MVMPNGSRIGNPPHVPTDESRIEVQRLAETLPSELIAKKMGIARSTLWLHYRQELADAKASLGEEFGTLALQKIRNGDNDMLKFWLARRGGWEKTERHEHSGPGGGPIAHVDLARLAEAFAGMSEDELAVAERVLSLVASSGTPSGPDGGGGSAAAVEGGAAESTP
jgi:hypothetical protein